MPVLLASTDLTESKEPKEIPVLRARTELLEPRVKKENVVLLDVMAPMVAMASRARKVPKVLPVAMVWMLLRVSQVLRVPREPPDPLDHLVLVESPDLVDKREIPLPITCYHGLELQLASPMVVFSTAII